MADYQAIFAQIESALFREGSRNVPLCDIQSRLEPSKHLEGKRFSDDECFRKLVHIVFYSGFRAETVSSKLPVIDHHLPDYATVSRYEDRDIDAICRDQNMIRNRQKVRACVANAKEFALLVAEFGSFQSWIESLPYPESDSQIIQARQQFQSHFKFLGVRTAFHLMADVGLPVLKPDRVIERIFKRLDLVPEGLKEDTLYIALIQEGRNFATATGYPIRYIDRVFVAYGQERTSDLGLEQGICLASPRCSVCGCTAQCGYYARQHMS